MDGVHDEVTLLVSVMHCRILQKDHLNYDPMYELEEMIIEEKPLHKKKKRLAKQNCRKEDAANDASIKQPVDTLEVPLRRITHEYKTYNREKYVVCVCV